MNLIAIWIALIFYVVYSVYVLIVLSTILQSGSNLGVDDFKSRYNVSRKTVQTCYYVVIIMFVLAFSFLLLLLQQTYAQVFEHVLDNLYVWVISGLFLLIVCCFIVNTFRQIHNSSQKNGIESISVLSIVILLGIGMYYGYEYSMEHKLFQHLLKKKKS
jgi:hypothetical protein